MWISKLLAIGLLAIAAHAWAAVDINTASAADIDSIKGIGPSTLTKIISQRNLKTFKNWTDLIERVSGIGPKRAMALSSNGLTVNGERFYVVTVPAPLLAPAATHGPSPTSLQVKK